MTHWVPGLVGHVGPALALALVLPGCVKIRNPLRDLDTRDDLRRAESFVPTDFVREPPVSLEETPKEAPADLLSKAKAVIEAPADRRMTLSDVRREALVNNLGLQVDLFEPALAEERYNASRARFEAIFSMPMTHSRSTDFEGLDTSSTTLQPTILVPLETGGSGSIGVPWTYTDAEIRDPNTGNSLDSQIHDAGLKLNLRQPLLRNAGFAVNLAPVHVSGLQMRQADARAKLDAIRLLANAEKAYWLHYNALEGLRIAMQQYELALQQLQMAQRLVDEGVRTSVEITRSQSGVARRFEFIVRAETSRRRSERELKRVMNIPGMDVDSKSIIIPDSPPAPLGMVFDRDALVEAARKNRMELLENEIQQTIDRLNLDVADNALLPDLTMDFSYSFSGSRPQFDDALEQIFNDELNSWALGVSLQIPLQGDRAAQARMRAALLDQTRTQTTRRLLEQSITQEVLDAVDAVEQGWQQILASRMGLSAAEDTYDAEKTSFQIGTRTSTEVLDALAALAEAQLAQALALSSYQTSIVDLGFATGMILDQSGIVWTPPVAGHVK